MRIGFAAAFVLLSVAACGVNVPAGLEDKLKACPGMVKPEPVAVITKGQEVAEVKLERDTMCIVKTKDDHTTLDIGLIGYPSQELAERNTAMLCQGREWDGSDKSCAVSPPGGGRLIVHGVAGRWEVRVAVYQVQINDEVKEAAYQILKDLRNSDKTK